MTLNDRILTVIREEGPIEAGQILEQIAIPREDLYASLVHFDALGLAHIVPENSANGSRRWEAA